MRRTTSNVGCIVALVVLVCGTAMGQGEDLANDPNGFDAWMDNIFITGPVPGVAEILAVWVEFCVYEPGQFQLSFPGEDPSGGSQWVYAYQVFNNISPHPAESIGQNPDYVSRLSVGLDADEAAQGCYYVPGTGIVPDGTDVIDATSTQAGWDFTQGQMAYATGPDPPPAISAVLFFTSPCGPELDRTTASGAYPGLGWVASPLIPEPGTLAILLAGLGLWMRKKR